MSFCTVVHAPLFGPLKKMLFTFRHFQNFRVPDVNIVSPNYSDLRRGYPRVEIPHARQVWNRPFET